MNNKFLSRLQKMQNWHPPKNWQKITTVDTHTAGEPLRIILSGIPELPGDTVLIRRKYMKDHLDHLRTALMWEPRGHADQYGCIIFPPVTKEADFGIMFLHNEGYSTMCGHAIIAITKVILETGMIPKKEPITTVRINSPAGLITSHARINKGKVKNVFFHNVPSFVLTMDQFIDVPGLGNIRYDIAFGGAFYAFVKAEDVSVEMTPESYRDIIEKGMAIKNAVMKNFTINHPFENELNFLYGAIFTGPSINSNADSRNVCVFAEGEVDRSPTGTGVSARMALHYTRGEIESNQSMVIESILGTTFKCKIVEITKYGPYNAVIPQVEGNAFITGKNEFYIDPDDPLKHGFIFR